MFKRAKKQSQINIEEKKGHLFLGDDENSLRLLMLRPIDIIEFSEFAGANAVDILAWTGKTLGKNITEKIFAGENWTGVDMSTKKKAFVVVIETLEQLGYGALYARFEKNSVSVTVHEPLSTEEKANFMAKNICVLYLGLFNGVLEALNIDAEGKEETCFLIGGENDIFKYQLLADEVKEEDIDQDEKKPEKVANFLKSL